MKIGASKIDFKALLIDGPTGRQSIEPKIMTLLQVLADNAGQVMSREELITAVWGVTYGGDESLSRGISILRKALGDKRGAHTHIVTISRRGYRLIADVELEDFAPTETEAEQLKQAFQVQGSPRATPQKAEPSLNDKKTPDFIESTVQNESTVNGSKSSRLTGFGWAAAAATLLLTCVIMFSLPKLRGETELSLQANIDLGFSHVENFTRKDAIGEANDIFGEVLSDNPNHAAARAGMAFAIFREYTHLERDPALLQMAKAHAQAALREDQHLALANIAVAWAAEFDGDFDRAHASLDIADILDPGNRLSVEGRYRSFLKQGQVTQAQDLIAQAIENDPDHALYYSNRGDLLLHNGDSRDAERDFRKAINLSPDSPRIYAQLAHCLHMQDRTNEAVEAIQQGLKINETALLYNNLGTYLFFQGHYDLAGAAFEKTLSLSGDTHDYLYWANIGDAYRWSRDGAEKAVTSYKRALQLLQVDLDRYPEDINLKSRAAMFNAKLGDLDEAKRHLDSFEVTPNSPSILLYRSVVTHEILSNRPAALKYLEAAISAGYPKTEIFNDPELTLLRQDPAYHRLLARQ